MLPKKRFTKILCDKQCQNTQRSLGFTLVELLLVVIILSVLAVSIISLVNARGLSAKGRDAKRVADIRKMQSVLEVYFADNQDYPTSEQATYNDWRRFTGLQSQLAGYITDIPVDVKRNGGTPCLLEHYGYYYRSLDNQSAYVIATRMELEESTAGFHCTTDSPIADVWDYDYDWCPLSGGGFTAETYCYGVTSPQIPL